MEENQPKTGKFALNFGIMLGVLSIIFALMLYMADMHYEQSWGLFAVNFAIMAGVITFGISQFKKENNGLLTLSEALKVGVGIALVGGILGVIYQMLFMNFIEPDFIQDMMAMKRKEMIAQNPNMSKEEIKNATEMMKTFSGPFISAAFALIGSLFFGLIISLFSGLILKKQKSTF